MAVTRLAELTRKADAFFVRVTERHGTDMQCASGCSDCCHVRLTITEVEAAAIRAHVAGWPAERRLALAVAGSGDSRCAALDAHGRCKIYDARPLVCRTHGVPIRMGQGALAVVRACHRNFARITPDSDCILDQATLSAMLLAVDAAEARTTGAPRVPAADAPARRVELAGVLADLAAI
jgi:hypothetical protein